jgi:hypothetical protein
MNIRGSSKLLPFASILLKSNISVFFLFYAILSLLIFSIGYLFINSSQLNQVHFITLLILSINILIFVCIGFVLEIKEAVQFHGFKMIFKNIFLPWVNLNKFTHMNTYRYSFNTFGYFYIYGISYFLILLLSFAVGWSSVKINPYLFPFIVVLPNALFQVFFVALPFTAVLAPTEQSLYYTLLSIFELFKYSIRIVRPYRWHIFLAFVLFPWFGMVIWYLFLDNIFGHLNMLIISFQLTLISSLLFFVHFIIMSILVIHIMTPPSDQSINQIKGIIKDKLIA